MSRQSESINPLGKVGYKDFLGCHYFNKNYLVRTISNNWRYCESYINQCLGDDETKKVKKEKKKRSQLTNRYHQSNYGNQ